MSTPAALARAFAAALLDGPWETTAMTARLGEVIADQPRWLRSLAIAVRRHYPDPPHHRAEALADWLQTRRAFRLYGRKGQTVRRWATSPPTMGPSPFNVPPLCTLTELAAWLELDVKGLEILADRRGLSRRAANQKMRHYRYHWVPKRSGGYRLLEAPKARLRTAQRRILDGILSQIRPHAAAHGFRAAHSIVTFTAPHVDKAVVLRVDLKSFFPSIFASRIRGIFRTAGYPAPVARLLTSLCTHATPLDVVAASPAPPDPIRQRTPHLPQGAPTSGALANLAAYRLDLRVAALARTLHASYSRYADDLVLSGGRNLLRASPTLIPRLAAIATEEGFALNFRKTRVMTAGTRQRITGVVVNAKPSLAREDQNRLRAILHNCTRSNPSTQNRENHPDFRAYLQGRISWTRQISPSQAARLQTLFDRIVWDG